MAEKIYRVRADQLVAVLHPDMGRHVVPDPRAEYPADDPLVKEYPWMFATDEQLIAERESTNPLERAVPANPSMQRRAKPRKSA